MNNKSIKQRIEKYGLMVGYSFLGMFSAAFFSYKIVSTRLKNMENIKKKSKIPQLHSNMKRVGILGVIGVGLYSYGLWQIIKRLPSSQTTHEIGDYTPLAQWKRKNPELQDHYIFKTMNMFGVSEDLLEKTKDQFKKMGTDYSIRKDADENLSFQLFKTLMSKKTIEITKSQYAKQNQKSQQKGQKN